MNSILSFWARNANYFQARAQAGRVAQATKRAVPFTSNLGVGPSFQFSSNSKELCRNSLILGREFPGLQVPLWTVCDLFNGVALTEYRALSPKLASRAYG
jgi:hypothetical protein